MSFVKDTVSSITGADAADAAKRGGKLQYLASQEDRAQSERLSAPYRQLGQQNIQGLQSLIDNPMGYLQNNPMFDAALNSANVQSGNQAALSGKFNSGGMVNSLFQNYLATGDNLINSQYNRLLSPIQMGQASAANQAAMSSGAITGGANAQAAGLMGAANARSQGVGNMIGLGALAFSDSRLKHNIIRHGQDTNGNTLYRFSYNGDEIRYLGYMAQDLLKTDPEHVILDDSGFYKVTEKYAPVRLS